jgi:MSHA biogenesis protein MshI
LKKSAAIGLLGIEFGAEGIAVAHVKVPGSARPVLQSCRFLPNIAGESPPLRQYIAELGLNGAACNAVIPSSKYSLLLSEAPIVKDAELADAMRWKIKDLIDFPVEEAFLDVFRLPDDASRGDTPMVYVVVSRRSVLEDIVALLDSAGLKLGSIDIIDLALRNLSLLCPAERSGIAMVQLTSGTGNLNVIRKQQLYLSRRFDIDFDGGLLDPLPANSLALELQRSLDYYERQMDQESPSSIYLCGEGVSRDKVSEAMQTSLVGELKVLPLGELMVLPEGCDELTLTNCIGAIGGALRHEYAA